MPTGYNIAVCAAYGQFNSATRDGLNEVQAALTRGLVEDALRTIDRVLSSLSDADKAFADLPAWAPAAETVADFRRVLGHAIDSLELLARGVRTDSQEAVDQSTMAMGRMSAPMARAYSGIAALGANHGLRCDEGGFAPPETAPPAPLEVDLSTGESFVAGPQTVTLLEVSTWPGESFFLPDRGNIFVTLKLRVDASSETFINTLQTDIQTADGTLHPARFIGFREPDLESGFDLSAGESASGYLTFEVPRDLVAQPMTLLYPSEPFGSVISVQIPSPGP